MGFYLNKVKKQNKMSKYFKQMEKVFTAYKTLGNYDTSIVKQMKVLEASHGKLKCEMKVTNDFVNINGSLHGGFQSWRFFGHEYFLYEGRKARRNTDYRIKCI